MPMAARITGIQVEPTALNTRRRMTMAIPTPMLSPWIKSLLATLLKSSSMAASPATAMSNPPVELDSAIFRMPSALPEAASVIGMIVPWPSEAVKRADASGGSRFRLGTS